MLQASFRIKNKLSTLTGNDTEMDPAMSPHKVKGDWTRCLKSLEKFKLPASCATATAIYANCRILLDTKLGIVPLMIDHGEIDFSLVNDFTETLDFVAATLHWPKVFRNCLKRMLEAHPGVFEQNEGDKIPFNDVCSYYLTSVTEKNLLEIIGQNAAMLLFIARSMTDAHLESQRVCCENGFIKFLLQDLLPKLHNIKWNESNIRKGLLEMTMGIIYNCSRISENISYYEEYNAVDILVEIRNETDHVEEKYANILAFFTLAYLINDKNNDDIVPNIRLIETVLGYLSCSLTQDYYMTFHAYELADALAQLAVNDKNKILICKADGVKVFANMLEAAKDEKERISACRGLWSICFVKEGVEAVTKLPDLLRNLNKLKLSENQDVQRAAEGVLWELKASDRISQGGRHPLSSSRSQSGQVMISYNWDHQKAAIRISQLLKSRGYNVWIDVDKMEGSIIDAMALAVEESEVILMCVSRKYKLSPNCRSEADYAFQLHKRIIPLMVEKNFIPDGWLGLLLGSKLRLDFTNLETIESDVNTLVKHLGSTTVEKEHNQDDIPSASGATLREKGDQRMGCQSSEHYPTMQSTEISLDEITSFVGKPGASQIQTEYSRRRAEMDLAKTDKVTKWKHDDVLEWLTANGMKGLIRKDKLQKLMGYHIVLFYHLSCVCPDVYYNCLRTQLGFDDILDFLTFDHHLEDLFGGSRKNEFSNEVLPGSRGHCDFTGSKADQGGFHLKGHKGEARKIAEEEINIEDYHSGEFDQIKERPIFEGCQMHLILEPGFSYKKKKELKSLITSHHGSVSHMITKQTTHVLVSSANYAKNSYKCEQAKAKSSAPVVLCDYIKACIEEEKLLDPVKFIIAT